MTARSRLGSEEETAGLLGRILRESGEDQGHVGSGAGPELERLLRTVSGKSQGRARPPGFRTWLLVAAALVVVGSLGSFVWERHEAAALTFSTNGTPRRGPVAIVADSERAVDLEFSDGTVFNVEPSARLRVESSSANGARLTLVAGKTVAHVVHRSSASWSVAAGPFEVRVTGTRFGARWDATHERLSVDLYEGSVQVVGGALTTPISVRAGQRLEAGRGTGDWLLTSLDGPATPPDSEAPPPGAAAPPSASEPPSASDAPAAPGSAIRAAAPTSEWPALLGRADFEGILRQADDFGIERCFSNCSPGALRMLADSARYLGRYSLAERSLLALRKRSPTDAGSTAFLLGRLEESREPSKALSWYEKSLEEEPHGAYAAEAQAGRTRMLPRR